MFHPLCRSEKNPTVQPKGSDLKDATGKTGAFPGTAQLSPYTVCPLMEAEEAKTLFGDSNVYMSHTWKHATSSGKKKPRVWIPSLEVTGHILKRNNWGIFGLQTALASVISHFC